MVNDSAMPELLISAVASISHKEYECRHANPIAVFGFPPSMPRAFGRINGHRLPRSGAQDRPTVEIPAFQGG